MKRTRVDDLHKEWMKNPKYRREYKALEEEFSLTAGPDRGPIPCGPHAAAGSPAHEDDAGSGGAAGRRRQYAIHANLGKIRKGHRKQFAHQLRAGTSPRRVTKH